MARSYFGKSSIRPHFLHDQNSEDPDSALFRQQIASNSLKDAELDAARPAETANSTTSSLDTVRSAERSNLYTGTGKPSRSPKSTKAGKFRGLRKGGPAAIITAVVAAAAFFILGASTNLGAQWEDRITRATDPMNTSYAINTTRITREMLDGKRDLPDYMRKRFEKQGITVDNEGRSLTFNGKTITASNFDDIIKTDVDFRESFTKAKRGRVANFYDSPAETVMKRLHLTRDVFHDHTTTDDEATDRARYQSIESDQFDNGTNTKLNTVEEKIEYDEDGNPVTKRSTSGTALTASGTTGESATAKAKNFLFGTAAKVSNAGNIGCALLKVGNLVAVAVAGNMIYQSIHYFMINAETISKTKSGDGEHSGMNSFLNFLNESSTETYTDVDTGEEKEITGAPIMAEGQKFILSDEKPNQNITKNFTIETAFAATSAALLLNGYDSRVCAGAQAANAIVSLSTLFVPGGGLIRASIGMLTRTIASTGIQLIASTALAALIPIIASSMFSNPAETKKGVPAGELLTAGAGATNSRIGRSSSAQAIADSEQIETNVRETAYINHLEAEVERNSRSPFDPTSEYTFFGHLLGQIAAIGNNRSVLTGVTSTLSLTSRSIASLSTTYADGAIGTAYQTTYGNCPNLESIGVKGDIYCNPIVVSDLNTARIASDDPAYLAVINRNTTKDSSGKYHIKDNSDLAKYIIYCTERDSPFGVYDANIANAEEKSLGIVGDNLPFVDDVMDMINAVESLSTTGWADGTYCGASKQNPYWKGNFEYLQHFIEDQRICTQMGCKENLDLATGESYNPILAFKEDYYTEHPLDDSRAGTLARISGLAKTDAESVLALYDYQEYLANYTEPTTIPADTDSYLSSLARLDELKSTPSPDSPSLFEIIATLLRPTTYADLRNRNYAA